MGKVEQIEIIDKDGSSDLKDIGGKASNINYNNDSTTLQATNVQDAIEELYQEIQDISIVPADKMDKSNPAGDGSLSLNRKSDTVIGDYSIAIGYENEANEEYSYAEGFSNLSAGSGSHTEGKNNIVSSEAAHAEGLNNITSGIASHIEGVSNRSTGLASHTEGEENKTLGNWSHAEGYQTSATGDAASAHGNNTIAEGNASSSFGNSTHAFAENETVVGEYNEVDPGYSDRPLFVVGIGEDGALKDGLAVLKDGTTIVDKDIIITDVKEDISMLEVSRQTVENTENIDEINKKLGNTDYRDAGSTITGAIKNTYELAKSLIDVGGGGGGEDTTEIKEAIGWNPSTGKLYNVSDRIRAEAENGQYHFPGTATFIVSLCNTKDSSLDHKEIFQIPYAYYNAFEKHEALPYLTIINENGYKLQLISFGSWSGGITSSDYTVNFSGTVNNSGWWYPQGSSSAMKDWTCQIFYKAEKEPSIMSIGGALTDLYNAQGGGGSAGAATWDELTGKPFNTLSNNFKVDNGVLDIDGDFGSKVSVTPNYTEGTKVATITVDSKDNNVYVPVEAVELTLAEYEALSPTEKIKDITYYITDMPATSADLAEGVSFATHGGEENTLRFGYDAEKEVYGYYPPGADTLVPFKSGGGSGGGDIYIIKQEDLKDAYIAAGGSYVYVSSVPYNFSKQSGSQDVKTYLSGDQYWFGYTYSGNVNAAICHCIRASQNNYKTLYIDCDRISSRQGSYNTAAFYFSTGCRVSGIYRGNIYNGTTLKSISLTEYNWTVDQINAQAGVKINAVNNYNLPRQTIEIDISEISQDFYVCFHSCDGAIGIYNMWYN